MGVIQELEKFADRMPEPGARHSVLQTVHILRYPMKDILAKVPGDTLKERAKAVGVSRQTMYVWAHERFRPSKEQAHIISDLTGIPVWQIRDLQADDDPELREASVPAGGGVAEDGESVPSGKRRNHPVVYRTAHKSRLGKRLRTLRRRSSQNAGA